MRVRGALVLAALVAGALAFTSAEQEAPAQSKAPVEPAAQEKNKALARRVFIDLFTRGRYEQLDEIYDKGCKVHFGGRTAPLDQVVAEGKGWRKAAPDLIMTPNEVTANDDIVTVKWTARATHSGAALGMKPTGKKVALEGTSKFRFANGKIVEAWNTEYREELFRQLGVPKPAALLMMEADDLRWKLSDMFSGPSSD